MKFLSVNRTFMPEIINLKFLSLPLCLCVLSHETWKNSLLYMQRSCFTFYTPDTHKWTHGHHWASHSTHPNNGSFPQLDQQQTVTESSILLFTVCLMSQNTVSHHTITGAGRDWTFMMRNTLSFHCSTNYQVEPSSLPFSIVIYYAVVFCNAEWTEHMIYFAWRELVVQNRKPSVLQNES